MPSIKYHRGLRALATFTGVVAPGATSTSEAVPAKATLNASAHDDSAPLPMKSVHGEPTQTSRQPSPRSRRSNVGSQYYTGARAPMRGAAVPSFW